MAFVLRLFPRSIRIKGHLATPAFALGKVSEFRAVVNGNGFEHLREWSPPPSFGIHTVAMTASLAFPEISKAM